MREKRKKSEYENLRKWVGWDYLWRRLFELRRRVVDGMNWDCRRLAEACMFVYYFVFRSCFWIRWWTITCVLKFRRIWKRNNSNKKLYLFSKTQRNNNYTLGFKRQKLYGITQITFSRWPPFFSIHFSNLSGIDCIRKHLLRHTFKGSYNPFFQLTQVISSRRTINFVF